MRVTLDKLTPGTSKKLNLGLDLGALFLAFSVATEKAPHDAWSLWVFFVQLCGWVVAVTALRLYSPVSPRRRLDSIVLLFIAVAGVMMLGAVIQALSELFGHTFVFESGRFFQLFAACVVASNVLCKPLAAMDSMRTPVLIVGTGPLARATYERLSSAKENRREVIGFVRLADDLEAPVLPVSVIGEADDFLDIVSRHAVSEVYIAARVMEQGGSMQQIVKICEEVGLPFAVPLHSLQLERAQLLSSSAARDGYLHYMPGRPQPLQHALKRLFDILASLAALIVLSPLLIGVAAAIKLTSRGPVMFKQVRVGLHGSHFQLFKFRSMVVNAEELKQKLAAQNEQTGPVFKMKNDPRITGIGRFIRKYSIDELPQLLNILRGDMSVVGPRPAIPSEVAQYKAWQRRRLSVRPGLTCYWQVSGRNEIGFDEWMRLDLDYVDNWDMSVDIALIARTVPVVITGRGAS